MSRHRGLFIFQAKTRLVSNKKTGNFFSRFRNNKEAETFVSTLVQSVGEEIVSRRKLLLRFEAKRASVSSVIRDKYAGCTAAELLSNTSDTKILAHARNLGLNPSITAAYKPELPANFKPRGLTRQATDYLRLWLQFEHYFEMMIQDSIKKNYNRQIEYAYYEHLSK